MAIKEWLLGKLLKLWAPKLITQALVALTAVLLAQEVDPELVKKFIAALNDTLVYGLTILAIVGPSIWAVVKTFIKKK